MPVIMITAPAADNAVGVSIFSPHGISAPKTASIEQMIPVRVGERTRCAAVWMRKAMMVANIVVNRMAMIPIIGT